MVDKFVNKDGKEVLVVEDDNTVFIDKELKNKKKKKEFKDDSTEGKVLSEDSDDNSDRG